MNRKKKVQNGDIVWSVQMENSWKDKWQDIWWLCRDPLSTGFTVLEFILSAVRNSWKVLSKEVMDNIFISQKQFWWGIKDESLRVGTKNKVRFSEGIR